MNQAKISKQLRGQSSAAKKVYEVVPIQESWPRHKIMARLAELGVSASDSHVLGCLKSLVDDGLVREYGGEFQRVQAKPKQPLKAIGPMVRKEAPAAQTDPEPGRDPLEIIDSLLAKVDDLKEELTRAALEIEEYIEDAKGKADKMRQLQALLKGLGD